VCMNGKTTRRPSQRSTVRPGSINSEPLSTRRQNREFVEKQSLSVAFG